MVTALTTLWRDLRWAALTNRYSLETSNKSILLDLLKAMATYRPFTLTVKIDLLESTARLVQGCPTPTTWEVLGALSLAMLEQLWDNSEAETF